MADLLDLAARCEAAEGPDRELDGEIWCRIYRPHYRLPTPIEWQRGRPKTPPNYLRAYGLFNGFIQPPKCPAYTASLDAGKTLLASGTLWTVGSMEDGPFARLCWPQPDGGFVGGYIEAKAKTAENALVSAALRARSAQP